MSLLLPLCAAHQVAVFLSLVVSFRAVTGDHNRVHRNINQRLNNNVAVYSTLYITICQLEMTEMIDMTAVLSY